jgi:Bardet-Biedl syndrome 4 protein
VESFRKANAITKHDSTYLQLGKLFTIQEDYKAAVDCYMEALE